LSSIQRVGDGAAVAHPLLDLLLLVNSLWQGLHQSTPALCMCALAPHSTADLRSARLASSNDLYQRVLSLLRTFMFPEIYSYDLCCD